MADTYQLTTDEKNSLRSYLQRAEARLSTVHRIAGTFLGGAGLLVLFTPFYKDFIANILGVIYKIEGSNLPNYVALIFMIVIALPLISLYYLLKEIVLFYFTPNHPGQDKSFFHPRFILTGLSVPTDDINETVLTKIVEKQCDPDLQHFLLPYDKEELKYYNSILEQTKDKIVPKSRLDILKKLNKNDDENAKQFYAAFGIASVNDRPLIEEVARIETSLVRHTINLRRLLLRYTKSFILFIWTSLCIIVINDIATFKTWDKINVLCIGFIFWAIFAFIAVKLPIHWIYQLESKNEPEKEIKRDSQLVFFEHWRVIPICIVVIVASIIILFVNN